VLLTYVASLGVARCFASVLWFILPRRCPNTQSTLQILKDATLFFSRSTPNLATVILAMDVIDEKLTTQSLDCSRFDASIRASLGIAKKTLNRYYNMTDWSEVYRIAMGEFPMMCCSTCDGLPSFCSATPLTQARLLQEHQLGGFLGQYC
jgi:hypothetical protein